jgi:hypothetical protein
MEQISIPEMQAIVTGIRNQLIAGGAAEDPMFLGGKSMGDTKEEAEQLFRANPSWGTALFSGYLGFKRADGGPNHIYIVTAFVESYDKDIKPEDNHVLIKIYDRYYFTSNDRVMNKLVGEPMIRDTFRFKYGHVNELEVAKFLSQVHARVGNYPYPASSSI